MRYYLTCAECGHEPEHISFRGDRLVHRCPQGHQTTEVDERWFERVVAVWNSFYLKVPMSIGMRRYNVRKYHFRVLDRDPSMRLRAIIRVKEYKDGR